MDENHWKLKSYVEIKSNGTEGYQRKVIIFMNIEKDNIENHPTNYRSILKDKIAYGCNFFEFMFRGIHFTGGSHAISFPYLEDLFYEMSIYEGDSPIEYGCGFPRCLFALSAVTLKETLGNVQIPF